MKTNNNILKQLLDSTIEFTSELMELGYSLQESFMYVLMYISEQRTIQKLSAEEYVELEGNYMQRIYAFA